MGSNFYWLSTKPEVLDWDKSEWYVTPTKSFADFTALATLPKVKLNVTSATARKGPDTVTTVKLENPSNSLAFFVRLKLTKGAGGDEVLPVLLGGQLPVAAARREAHGDRHGSVDRPRSGETGGRGQRDEPRNELTAGVPGRSISGPPGRWVSRSGAGGRCPGRNRPAGGSRG